ncbi:MAG TPA: aldo/keto reductase [Chryseolinea sp.]|nr:aldo/keto reductase [Chryseolinea sp.]
MNRRDYLHSLAALSLMPLTLTSMGSAEPLIKRIIPASGEKITPVGVGTWQTFDAGSSEQESEPLRGVLKALIEKSGTVIDSSPMYGRSQQVAGTLSTEMDLNSKLFIATKVWTTGQQEGIEQMNRSMASLKRTKIDLMQVHNLVDWQSHLKTLKDWKDQGKIRYIGITHYLESAYDEVERIMKGETIDFLQINYSLASRTAAERLFPLAQERRMGVIINQPFEEGGLFRSVKGKALPEWASEFDCNSWAQFFLKFIIAEPAVTCVVPGTSKPQHMLDNMGAAFGKLPTEKQRSEMIKLINV